MNFLSSHEKIVSGIGIHFNCRPYAAEIDRTPQCMITLGTFTIAILIASS